MYLNSPSGGFKVVYEYANRLQHRGHGVSVVHPRNIEPQSGVSDAVKSYAWPFKLRLKNRPLVGWFPLRAEVKPLLVPDLRERFIPDCDAVVATAFNTAFPVSGYSKRKGRKFYLIQSFEDWNGAAEQVRASWLLPLHKVVISRWLWAIAEELGEQGRTDYIPIGMDFSHFRITNPIEHRITPCVGMLAHPNEIKGFQDGIAALELAKREMPELRAVLFGTHPRPGAVPAWVEYEYRPSPERLAALYNSCQVYLHPSWSEGWGLTAAEAMACGCALISADNGGVNEFATDGESALLAPIKSPELLARQLIRVLVDHKLRSRIAMNGSQQVRQFTWDRAVETFEKVLFRGE